MSFKYPADYIEAMELYKLKETRINSYTTLQFNKGMAVYSATFAHAGQVFCEMFVNGSVFLRKGAGKQETADMLNGITEMYAKFISCDPAGWEIINTKTGKVEQFPPMYTLVKGNMDTEDLKSHIITLVYAEKLDIEKGINLLNLIKGAEKRKEPISLRNNTLMIKGTEVATL